MFKLYLHIHSTENTPDAVLDDTGKDLAPNTAHTHAPACSRRIGSPALLRVTIAALRIRWFEG